MPADVSLTGSNATSISGSIKWTGLGSGVDFATVVDQLIEIEKTHMTRLTIWKNSWEDKITSIQGLNSRMSSAKSFYEDFNSFEEFYSRSSSSSDSTILTTTNTSSAVPGVHNVEVGTSTAGRVATRSFEDAIVVGGVGGQLLIRMGDPDDAATWQTVTLTEGVAADWDGTVDDIDALATAINTVDDAGADILEAVEVVVDKDRGGTTYKRLMITGKSGGDANQLWVVQPAGMDLFYEDATNLTAIDEPYYETNWNSTGVSLSKTGTYTGSTNKTFTFMLGNTGAIGALDINVTWADTEGNSGSFVVDDYGSYTVAQGVSVSFDDLGGDDIVFAADSFTMDVYHSTLQKAQDKGLAQVEQRVHSGFIDEITEVTSVDGTFSYYYAGEQTTVNIMAGATLGDLRDTINLDSDNPGVTASIINDGTATTTAYHLVLTGNHTGAEHTITTITGTLDNFDDTDADFETTQDASNSQVKVDGFPSASYEYLQRSDNSISDVITGVTLNLRDTGSTVVSVINNTTAIKQNIETMVNSLNFVLDYIAKETKYNDGTGESGVMLGNYTYDIVDRLLNQAMKPTGLTDGVDTYTHLSQIGIKTDPNDKGRWSIDTAVLDTALATDLEAVARLFVVDSDLGSQGVAANLADKLDELTDSETGIGNVLIDNYNGIIKGIDDKIAYEEKRITLLRDRMELKFARLEAILGQLNSEMSYLESQIDSLPRIGSYRKR